MNRVNVYFILIIQIMISGATHIVAKAVVQDIDPSSLLLLRSIISAGALFVLSTLTSGSLRIDRKDWGSIALLGFLGVPLNQFLYLYGLKSTTAANGALLYAATPVFVLLLSQFTQKERITPKKLFGIILAFVGIAIVIFERGVDLSSGYAFGNLMILIAVIAWCLFTILGKPMITKYGALRTTTAMMIAGTIIYFPFGLISSLGFSFARITSLHWAGVLYLSLGTSVAGYFLWYHALGRIEASKAAVFSNGQPVFATILSLIFLDYSITGSFIVGGVITIAGIVITQLG
jgi:drug/metabolite transporter (DMT)-like permease